MDFIQIIILNWFLAVAVAVVVAVVVVVVVNSAYKL